MRVFAVVMLTLSAMGCTSEFRIKAVDSTRLDDYKKDGVNGVLFYQPQYMKTTYVFTTLVDKKGAVVGEAEKKTCTPVIQKEEIRIMPDFDHPWVILSEASMFARGQFSVGLSNGMLASVNSESTPQFTETLNAVSAQGRGSCDPYFRSPLPGGATRARASHACRSVGDPLKRSRSIWPVIPRTWPRSEYCQKVQVLQALGREGWSASE